MLVIEKSSQSFVFRLNYLTNNQSTQMLVAMDTNNLNIKGGMRFPNSLECIPQRDDLLGYWRQ